MPAKLLYAWPHADLQDRCERHAYLLADILGESCNFEHKAGISLECCCMPPLLHVSPDRYRTHLGALGHSPSST
eukprot:5723712-Amphidinium_carterae.1